MASMPNAGDGLMLSLLPLPFLRWQIPSNVTETKSSDVNRRSKYDKIKDQQKRGEMILPDSNFTTINYMLVDYKRDTAFYRLMEAAQRKRKRRRWMTF